MGLPIASFKLHFREARARVMPARDEAGRAFEGPGVDLTGDAARAAIARAAPVVAWLREREPDVVVRSLSMDLRTSRAIATLDPPGAEGALARKPRVVRVDPPASTELVDRAADLVAHLGEAILGPLRRRA